MRNHLQCIQGAKKFNCNIIEWQDVQSGKNVIELKKQKKWTRTLMATIQLIQYKTSITY